MSRTKCSLGATLEALEADPFEGARCDELETNSNKAWQGEQQRHIAPGYVYSR